MHALETYKPILQNALEDYQKSHPQWRLEVLVSLIERGMKSLQHYVEDPHEREINWNSPFVELHYPVDWNWQPRGEGGIAPGGHIFGIFTKRNTATKNVASNTLGKIMVHWFNAATLAEVTNWAWYEKLNNYYTPVLPLNLARQLNSIKNKREQREAFDELVRPFSIGSASIDFGGVKTTGGNRGPKQVTKQLAKMQKLLDFQGIRITGEINGRKIKMSLFFQIHPLIADYDQKKAYHPVIIGLVIEPEFSGRDVVPETPADWPQKDRELLWDELVTEIGHAMDGLIPKTESEDSIILSVNAKIKIPAEWWRPENRGAAIKHITDLQSQAGDLIGITVERAERSCVGPTKEVCPVCGWIHDRVFTQIKTDSGEAISLGGVLPDIVRSVHRAHENGFTGLSTKDDALLKVCGGYRHPCKAFDDLKCRDEYKRLFETRKRGFISLRGARGKSETIGSLPGMLPGMTASPATPKLEE